MLHQNPMHSWRIPSKSEDYLGHLAAKVMGTTRGYGAHPVPHFKIVGLCCVHAPRPGCAALEACCLGAGSKKKPATEEGAIAPQEETKMTREEGDRMCT